MVSNGLDSTHLPPTAPRSIETPFSTGLCFGDEVTRDAFGGGAIAHMALLKRPPSGSWKTCGNTVCGTVTDQITTHYLGSCNGEIAPRNKKTSYAHYIGHTRFHTRTLTQCTRGGVQRECFESVRRCCMKIGEHAVGPSCMTNSRIHWKAGPIT